MWMVMGILSKKKLKDSFPLRLILLLVQILVPTIKEVQIIMLLPLMDMFLRDGFMMMLVHNHVHSTKCLKAVLRFMPSGVKSSIVFSSIPMLVQTNR